MPNVKLDFLSGTIMPAQPVMRGQPGRSLEFLHRAVRTRESAGRDGDDFSGHSARQLRRFDSPADSCHSAGARTLVPLLQFAVWPAAAKGKTGSVPGTHRATGTTPDAFHFQTSIRGPGRSA